MSFQWAGTVPAGADVRRPSLLPTHRDPQAPPGSLNFPHGSPADVSPLAAWGCPWLGVGDVRQNAPTAPRAEPPSRHDSGRCRVRVTHHQAAGFITPPGHAAAAVPRSRPGHGAQATGPLASRPEAPTLLISQTWLEMSRYAEQELIRQSRPGLSAIGILES